MKVYEEFRIEVLEALQSSNLVPKEILVGDSITIKVDSKIEPKILKSFSSILDNEKIRYNTSFSPVNGTINILVFNS